MTNSYEYDEVAIEICGDLADKFFRSKHENIRKDILKLLNEEFDSITGIEIRNALDNYILKNYLEKVKNNPYVDETVKGNMEAYLEEIYMHYLLTSSWSDRDAAFVKNIEMIDDFCPEVFHSDSIGSFKGSRNAVKELYHEEHEKTEKAKLTFKEKGIEQLREDDRHRLMCFFNSNIGTEDEEIQECQKEYLKALLKKFWGRELHEPVFELLDTEVKFIAMYSHNWMLNSRLKELGYQRDKVKSYIDVYRKGSSASGHCIGNHIYIGKTGLTYKIFATACHETEHMIQHLEKKKNSKSKIGLDAAISDVLRIYYRDRKDFDVYNMNYRVEDIEKDAQKIGYHYARILLDTLGEKESVIALQDEEKLFSLMYRTEYDFRIDENGKKYTREEFLFNSLNEAISQLPEAISQFPALSVLYSENGNVKTFEEIMARNFKVNEPDKSAMLEDFCRYYISTGELDSLDLKKFPENIQTSIISRLISILSSENIQFSSMNRKSEVFEDINYDDKMYVEKFHLRVAKNIMTYINNNYQYIMQLQDNGKFTSIINMDYYDFNANGLGYEKRYENLACANSIELQELLQLALDAKKQKDEYCKKTQTKFNTNDLENSFEELLDETKMSDFEKSTNSIRSFTETLEHNEMGENDVPK